MTIKDYYKILNVKPDAPAAIIRQSYRKLAMKYHPDKNPDDELSAAVFSEIAEAYSVLNNSSARKNYNEQRHFTAVSEYKKPAETIESLTDKAKILKQKILHSDPFRMNRDALLFSIKQLFPEDISALLKTNETQLNFFLELIVTCSSLLTSVQLKNLIKIMQPLFEKHTWLQQKLQSLLNQQIKKERWEKYKVVLAIILAILLCVVIFFFARD
jgi:curved DNA-binding protein CbpA